MYKKFHSWSKSEKESSVEESVCGIKLVMGLLLYGVDVRRLNVILLLSVPNGLLSAGVCSSSGESGGVVTIMCWWFSSVLSGVRGSSMVSSIVCIVSCWSGWSSSSVSAELFVDVE